MDNYNDYEGMKWLAKQRYEDLIEEYSASWISPLIQYLLRYLPGRGLILLGQLVMGNDRTSLSRKWRHRTLEWRLNG